MLRSHQLRLLAAQLRQLTAASSAPTPPPRWLHSAAAALSVAAPPVDALPEDRLLRDEREEVVRSEVDVDLPDDAALPPASARAAAAAAAPLPPPPGVVRSSFPLNGRQWTLETGRLARMADGACVLRCGGTTVLATASWDPTSFNNRRSASPNAAPLQVDYREKLYAVGRIPGSYNKREGMGKEHELLASRRLDRALRPLLPRGFVYNTDVDTAVLSADGGDDPEVLAINAASAALAVSDIPWGGPLGAVRVVLLGGEVHINPAPATVQGAELRLLVAATRERVVLVEGEGQQVGEAELLRALRAGVAAARELLPPQHDLAARGGRPKRPTDLAGADPAAARRMADLARAAAARVLADPELGSAARAAALAGAKEELTEAMRAAGCWRAEFSRVPGSGCVAGSDVDHAFAAAVGAELRSLVLEQGLRPDGRGLIDLRAVHAEPDHVPVVHGSALFEAGDTQALATVTVGSRSEQQRVESLLGGEASKRLFVHYSLPAFASPGGDRRGPPGGSMRHEMDASAFVENALAPSLPSQADFPFTLRLNAEALGVDGGAPGAAVCGASLALSHAGVPLKALVAAVSVGLVTEGGAWSGEAATAGASDTSDADESALWAPAIGRHELLTDPCESEASNGDMELRVAGTATGVTACLLDVRLPGGVPLAVVEEALGRAQVARLRVLAAMEKALPQVRSVFFIIMFLLLLFCPPCWETAVVTLPWGNGWVKG